MAGLLGRGSEDSEEALRFTEAVTFREMKLDGFRSMIQEGPIIYTLFDLACFVGPVVPGLQTVVRPSVHVKTSN